MSRWSSGALFRWRRSSVTSATRCSPRLLKAARFLCSRSTDANCGEGRRTMRFDMLQKVLTASILAMATSCVSLPPTLAQDAPDPANALRLCADPANLPFSSDDPGTPGLYLEIGEAIGKAIGRPVSHFWYRTYFGKRAVRVTMLAKQCDATIGLPDSGDFMGPKVIFSRPLFNVGYAIVAPKGA